MLSLRKVATAGVLAIVLAAGGVAVAPAEDASAASANTSGLISKYVRQYSTWRTKTPGAGVYFTGSASATWDCCGGTLGFSSTSDYWTLGLRTSSGNQFSSRTYTGRNASGLFPNTAGVTSTLVFAMNTRAWGNAIDNWDSNAVASFSGTLNY